MKILGTLTTDKGLVSRLQHKQVQVEKRKELQTESLAEDLNRNKKDTEPIKI